jgi:hypothetical protein
MVGWIDNQQLPKHHMLAEVDRVLLSSTLVSRKALREVVAL